MAMISCDEGTDTIGDSLTSNSDNLIVSYDEYDVYTSSFVPDSIYSYNDDSFLGKVSDDETGTIVKSSFSFQFNMLENKHLPAEDKMGKADGKVIADSCHIILYFDQKASFGDTLAAMKMRLTELEKPIEDGVYYSNFDPVKRGYIRQNGIRQYQTFSLRSQTADSISRIYPNIRIKLDQPYTDREGASYNNYGTYILRKYFEHPEYFKNSYTFVHNVCPGFYAEVTDGEGLMAKFESIDLRVFYHYQEGDKTYNSFLGSSSTAEVLQTITVENDKEALKQLAADNSCTYLKSPAGIFTEVTLPVDDIKGTHGLDSLLSASVVFQRINHDLLGLYSFKAPERVLLIQKDSLNSFFAKARNYNNIYAFYTTLSKNAYSFASSSDVSNLVVRMYNAKLQGLKSDPSWMEKHPDWNKALLIPVQAITATSSTTSSSTAATPVGVIHEMGLTSTRLVRGTKDDPIKIKVVYAKFDD